MQVEDALDAIVARTERHMLFRLALSLSGECTGMSLLILEGSHLGSLSFCILNLQVVFDPGTSFYLEQPIVTRLRVLRLHLPNFIAGNPRICLVNSRVFVVDILAIAVRDGVDGLEPPLHHDFGHGLPLGPVRSRIPRRVALILARSCLVALRDR